MYLRVQRLYMHIYKRRDRMVHVVHSRTLSAHMIDPAIVGAMQVRTDTHAVLREQANAKEPATIAGPAAKRASVVALQGVPAAQSVLVASGGHVVVNVFEKATAQLSRHAVSGAV